MAEVVYARRAFANLERIADFLAEHGESVMQAALDAIVDAIEVLERHPEIGRPVEDGLREPVISRGRTGYIALYDYYPDDDLVVILAIRHQREAGYRTT